MDALERLVRRIVVVCKVHGRVGDVGDAFDVFWLRGKSTVG